MLRAPLYTRTRARGDARTMPQVAARVPARHGQVLVEFGFVMLFLAGVLFVGGMWLSTLLATNQTERMAAWLTDRIATYGVWNEAVAEMLVAEAQAQGLTLDATAGELRIVISDEGAGCGAPLPTVAPTPTPTPDPASSPTPTLSPTPTPWTPTPGSWEEAMSECAVSWGDEVWVPANSYIWVEIVVDGGDLFGFGLPDPRGTHSRFGGV